MGLRGHRGIWATAWQAGSRIWGVTRGTLRNKRLVLIQIILSDGPHLGCLIFNRWLRVRIQKIPCLIIFIDRIFATSFHVNFCDLSGVQSFQLLIGWTRSVVGIFSGAVTWSFLVSSSTVKTIFLSRVYRSIYQVIGTSPWVNIVVKVLMFLTFSGLVPRLSFYFLNFFC